MYKKIVLSCLMAVVTVSATIEAVEAARLGGGRSSGIQRRVTPPQRQAIPPSAAPQQQQLAPTNAAAARPQAPTAQPAQASGWRKWAAPLAGLAAGLGLAALLSHLGLGAEFAGILLAVLAVVVVIALLRRFTGGARAQRHAYAGGYPSPAPDAVQPAAFQSDLPTGGGQPQNIPAGFDSAAFERQAKVNFVRLQAANDAANLVDIRDFTTPEMFAEIKVAIDERGSTPQRTDVVMLNAEVLEVVEEDGRYVASVRFFGSLREENHAAPQALDEVWHLVKPIDGNRGWVLAGIQQNA